jgi:hypothetical protein
LKWLVLEDEAFWVNHAVLLRSRPNLERYTSQWQTVMAIQLIGVSDGNSLLTTGVYGVVKFITTIEFMDDLFKHPLWMMWRYVYPKEEDKVRKDVQEAEGKVMVEQNEGRLSDVERKDPATNFVETTAKS